MNRGISALTKVLNSASHGGGPDSDRYALQEIKGSKVTSMLLEVIIGQLMLLRNNMD